MNKALSFIRLLRWHLIYRGPQRDITIDTANGLLSVSSKDWLHGKYLYVRRSFEMDTMRSTMELLRRDGYVGATQRNCLLDVGANLGMICIPLIRQRCFQRAIAFEPVPNTYRLLKNNVNQNGLAERISCHQIALSSTSGMLEMELSDSNSGDHRMRHNARPGAYHEERRQTIHVPTQRLDEFLREHPDIQKNDVSVIWMDIQGHEGRFFEGASNSLHDGVAVVSEFWPYAIDRSGMSQSEYSRIVKNLFSHFHDLTTGQKRPIGDIDLLFDTFNGARQMCTVIFVRKH
jgi:FkbM family methyltransferase